MVVDSSLTARGCTLFVVQELHSEFGCITFVYVMPGMLEVRSHESFGNIARRPWHNYFTPRPMHAPHTASPFRAPPTSATLSTPASPSSGPRAMRRRDPASVRARSDASLPADRLCVTVTPPLRLRSRPQKVQRGARDIKEMYVKEFVQETFEPKAEFDPRSTCAPPTPTLTPLQA